MAVRRSIPSLAGFISCREREVGFVPKSRGADGKPTNYFRRILVRNEHSLPETDGQAPALQARETTPIPLLLASTLIYFQ